MAKFVECLVFDNLKYSFKKQNNPVNMELVTMIESLDYQDGYGKLNYVIKFYFDKDNFHEWLYGGEKSSKCIRDKQYKEILSCYQ